MKNAGLKCNICGATESQSGKPFTPAGLGAHKAHLHGGDRAQSTLEDQLTSKEILPLVCDICGKNQNTRGDIFRTTADVIQHKKKVHAAFPKSGAGNGSKNQNDNASKPARGRKALQIEANHVKFCPQCGFNMEIVNAAMALVNGSNEA
jgi:predicted RNA-binding Zn-ribbon protein involved in translation (DUF1610 family)